MPFIQDPLLPKTESWSIVIALVQTFYKNNYRKQADGFYRYYKPQS